MTTGRRDPARAFRVLRGALLGLSSGALATAAHGVAGGGLPDTTVGALLVVLVSWAGTAVAGRGRPLPTTLALLAVSQLCLHLLLTDAAHPRHPATSDGWPMLAGHVVATLVTAVLLTRASAALTAVAAALLGWVHALIARLAPIDSPRVRASAPPVPGHVLRVLLRRVRPRRGPPVFS